MTDINRIRSLLYVSADKRRMMDKSIECDSDAIIYDLEDAIAPENKPLARETLCAFAAEALASGKEIFVRVNDIATEFFRDDIEAAVLAGVKNIILPKADRPAVQRACEYIDSIEQKRRICGVCLIPLIETPSVISLFLHTCKM